MIKCSDDRDRERGGRRGHTAHWLSVGLLLPGEWRELRRDQR